jgi:tyrosyl-tRNA synthetase
MVVSGFPLSHELKVRGLINQITSDSLIERLDSEQLTFYIGFDPTAESLHVGNLLGLMMAKRLQLYGHRPILLAGGGTGMIGDPSGRSSERNLLDEATLRRNTEAIRGQLSHFVDFENDHAALLLDNAEWLSRLHLIDFLRDVGKHFTLAQMLAKESVKSRLSDQGISFTEFSYMVLQAYDFLQLFDLHQCELQIGGSDQWGNMTAGVDLIRRVRSATAHAMTWPLVTKSDGTKFGKSMGNAVWLDPILTPPYELYQFFVRVEDSKVIEYLKMFTFVPLEEIFKLEDSNRTRPELREAHHRLAYEVVSVVHGESQARLAEQASKELFGRGREDLALADDVPGIELGRQEVETGITVVDVLVRSGLATSRSNARRLIEQGGIYASGERLTADVTISELYGGEPILIRKGKKDYLMVRIEA